MTQHDRVLPPIEALFEERWAKVSAEIRAEIGDKPLTELTDKERGDYARRIIAAVEADIKCDGIDGFEVW